MNKETESSFGARMQGSEYEFESSLALAILENMTNLEVEMEDPDYSDVSWNHVKAYISAERHKYPNYREHWTEEEKQAIRMKQEERLKEQEKEDQENLVGTVHEDDLVAAKSILSGNFTFDDFKHGEFDGFTPDFNWIAEYIAAHRHEYPDYTE